MNYVENAKERREVLKRVVATANPRATSRRRLIELMAEEGYTITSSDLLSADLRAIKATKFKPPSGEGYWVVNETLHSATSNAVAEGEARARVRANGIKLLSLDGAVPIHLQTVDLAGHMTGQPFTLWKPPGVIATLSGSDGVVFWCEPDQADAVKATLTKMMLEG